jgi:hypothetical protein
VPIVLDFPLLADLVMQHCSHEAVPCLIAPSGSLHKCVCPLCGHLTISPDCRLLWCVSRAFLIVSGWSVLNMFTCQQRVVDTLQLCLPVCLLLCTE